MLKKSVTYTDLNDEVRTEELYFNLSRLELVEMEASTPEGLEKMITDIATSQNNKRILEFFKDFVLKSYGEKSEDGKRFVKSPELSRAFAETLACDELLFEVMSDPDAATAFMTGILPKMDNVSKIPAPTN